jgi:hypothetical protein
MHQYSRTHLSDQDLLKSAEQSNRRETIAIADALADLAEVDARQLYRPLGFDSTYAYIVGKLHRSEDSACKRIAAARAAHAFPAIYPMLADGRLDLSKVVALAPTLRAEITAAAAAELLAAAAAAGAEVAGLSAPGRIMELQSQLTPERVDVDNSAARARVAPLSPGRYALAGTLSQEMHDKLRYAQALLAVPAGGAPRHEASDR